MLRSLNDEGPCSEPLPSVSVIMPAYNPGPEIADAVSSVIGQIGVTTELIIVDDGSRGDSVRRLQAVATRYPDRVRLIRQANGGPASARNRGIHEAAHDWVAFLDHDDQWLPDKLKRQLEVAEKTNADVVFCAARNVGSIERVDQIRSAPDCLEPEKLYEHLLRDNFLTTSSVLVRRSRLIEVDGFDERWRGVEDWALWMKLVRAGCQFVGMSDPLVVYTWGDDSLSRSHAHMQEQRRRLITEELTTPHGHRLPASTRRQILASERTCSAWFLASAAPRTAAQLYLQALAYWPFARAPWKGLAKSLLGRV